MERKGNRGYRGASSPGVEHEQRPDRPPQRHRHRRSAAWRYGAAGQGRDRRPCARRRPAGEGERFSVGARTRQAQVRLVRLERRGVARLELFRRLGLREARPAARADERGAEGGGLERAHRGVVADGRGQGEERDAAAGHPGFDGQRRRPALVAALLAVGVRHAGGNRRLGLALRGPSSDAIGRGARRPDRFGDAVLVLGVAQPRRVRPAHRLEHAEAGGGPGAAADGRSQSEAAAQGADRRVDALQHPVLRRPRAGATPGRSASRPPSCRRRSATCCGRWSSFTASSIIRRR